MRPTSLFFFAHQDDEFGVFQHISLARDQGQRVCCAYLTSGVPSGASASVRDEESVNVLGKLGVASEDIFFAGKTLGIPDGQLVCNLNSAIDWISAWITDFGSTDSVFLPAWEGGHPDHDVLHAAVLIATAGIGLRLRQFPLYNGYQCKGPFFRVLNPLPANGIIESSQIPWHRRIQFLRYCLSYPSQISSWLGLLPFTFIHYLIHGIESVQEVSLRRLGERPHDGPLYYERRRFCTFPEVLMEVDACLKRKLILPTPSNYD